MPLNLEIYGYKNEDEEEEKSWIDQLVEFIKSRRTEEQKLRKEVV